MRCGAMQIGECVQLVHHSAGGVRANGNLADIHGPAHAGPNCKCKLRASSGPCPCTASAELVGPSKTQLVNERRQDGIDIAEDDCVAP